MMFVCRNCWPLRGWSRIRGCLGRQAMLGLGVALLLGTSSNAHAAPPEDPILRWNAVLLQANLDDHSGTYGPKEQGGPVKTARAFAIVHAAMFDAFNSIDGSAQPFFIKVPGAKGSSTAAAVAQAAHDTLAALFPSQASVFDDELAAVLGGVRDGFPKTNGVRVGAMAAEACLTTRADDGSDAMMTYTPGDLPGQHRPDPLHPTQGFYAPMWGDVTPFVLTAADQFPVPPPPPLDSVDYAVAYNEVKALGQDISTTRTAEQTIIGTFWGYDGTPGLGTPPRLYNQIARVIAKQRRNTPAQNARLFALLNLAQADAGIASWNVKYTDNFWRPILGVREADPGTGPSGLGDDNPLTTGDVNWTPLGAPASNASGTNFTPPFPAYTSGHATFGAASFQVLTRFYGTDRVPFSFMSDEFNGVTTDQDGVVRPVVVRRYLTLSQAMWENAMSRIYLGVHWRFDAVYGVDQGKSVGDWVFDHACQPVR